MRKIVVSVFVLFNALLSNAQHLNVRLGNFSGPNEPSICINPKNTQQMMAGSNLNFWYYSEDGGYTWLSDILQSPEHGVWGDPVIIADTAGDFYFFHLANPVSGNWIDRIVCQKFDKFSKTWSPGTYTGLNGAKAQDKHWAVVDPATNTIYVTWTQFDVYGSSNPLYQSNIMFSKSTDAGQTWSDAISINEIPGDCVDSDNTVEGAVPAVGPEGELYVAWGGPAGIVFDRSFDGGTTWLDQDIPVTAQVGGWDIDIPGIARSNGMPVTVCDLSNSPRRGTIYINYSDTSNGENDTDIWLVKSNDKGETWSLPKRVNGDGPGKHQFFTWMAIDQSNGNLYFVYYDRRNHIGNATDVYMAVSEDGGETFSDFIISENEFTPSASGYFFGDYNNISAANGVVRPIWTRRESNGSLTIQTAIVDLSVALPENLNYVSSLEQNAPNPFSEVTIFSFRLKHAADVKLSVMDLTGKELIALIDEKRPAGKYEYVFDNAGYGLSAGTYLFVLTSDDQSVKRKMMITK